MKAAPDPVGHCIYISGKKLAACAKSMPGSFPIYSAATVATFISREEALRERLQAIIDWANLAIKNHAEFDSHGVRNLEGPVFDAAREALAKYPAPQTNMDGWQDISTAHRDGSEILVWNGRRRHVAHFDKIEGEWVSSFKTTTKRLIVAPAPTLWSPLPDEPSTTEGQADASA